MAMTNRQADPAEIANIQSPMREWRRRGYSRCYTSIDMTFGEVRKWFKIEVYNSETGNGWQCKQIEFHVRKLANEIETGRFTPTCWTAGLMPWHEKNLFWPNGNDDHLVGIKMMPVILSR